MWTLSGRTAIANRTQQLLDEADSEIVVVLASDRVFTDALAGGLADAERRGVSVVVGTASADLRATVAEQLPDAEVFVSELAWLRQTGLGDETEISRLLLVDRETILVSSFHETEGGEREHEQAVFGRGFDNGLVAIVRRMLATGLPTGDESRDGSR